jgi:hypothetical protein
LPRPGTARDGAGRKAAPYRYWLLGREAELYRDGLVSLPGLPPLEQRAWLTLARAAVLRRRAG